MANLSVRNLTIHPLELLTIDRFEGSKEQTGDLLTNTLGTVNSFLNATEFKTTRTVAKGEPHKQDKVNVTIDPFKTKETNERTADPKKEVIRLVFKTDGHKYEVDVPSADTKSTVMKKLDGGKLELTAVYVPTGALLAVFSSTKLDAWMKELDNDWPLQTLSIPGTHNSPTCYKALPSVRCQAIGVPEQLRNGVRFLDVRVSAEPEDQNLALVHSAFPISLTGTKWFGDLCDDIYDFLQKHPSETVIMSVKREGTGKGTDQQMGNHLKKNYVDKKRDFWWTEPKVPRLGEARGRIIIMRRFGLSEELKKCWDGRGFGIDAAAWPDNCEDGRIGDGHIRVQDFYEISETQNVQKKIDFARGQLERAAEQTFSLQHKDKSPPFFVNFLSASNFFSASCWPERIAAKVNPSVVEYLCIRHGEDGKGPKKLKVGTGGTGIVVTDWVGANGDWDLIRCVVGMNARLQMKR
ncbi:PLC-like phosphodiesterase [Emericellopsis atlantica]|uniref:PLC-like phosphodiesterase n=1 Tax=Emericellopsis atlantica TaxID=2614577 RepID=A0A9P7ZTE8_9HYPO|nr:PLC-like phosphodiesterase [Emericellopsis atlantica]KAG9257935.1 PLC-like phosphodiesterase [Emericellopsis atlantica]